MLIYEDIGIPLEHILSSAEDKDFAIQAILEVLKEYDIPAEVWCKMVYLLCNCRVQHLKPAYFAITLFGELEAALSSGDLSAFMRDLERLFMGAT